MMNIWNKAVWVLLASPLIFASCNKNDKGELGPAPTATFTASTPKSVGLTTQVTFTSTATNAAFYEWDFGDGTRGTGPTVTHTYKAGGTVKTVLITSGQGGTGISDTLKVALPPVTDLVKQFLTGGSSKTWMLDNTVNAPIIVGIESDPGKYYNGAEAGKLPPCQADDEYTFSAANIYTYDAKTGTVVAPAQTCDAPRSGTSDFTFGPATGQGYAMITLKKAGAFIGATDAPDLTYRIIDIDAKHMVLRGGSGANGGTVFQYKLVAK